MQNNNKVAIVTGGSRGIGLAVARRLTDAGIQTVICSRSGLNTDDNQLIFPIKTDVSCRNQVDQLVKTVIDKWGRIDIVINNAGITKDNLIMRMTDAEWDQVININLTGTFYLCRAVIRQMLKQRYGRIVNISSVIGVTGNPGQINYAASKAGVIGLTKTLAKEVASRQILVNAVAPGYIDTDMTAQLSEIQRQQVVSQIPLGKTGKAQDVAELVYFLASDANQYITGQTIHVDGGLVI